jgi:hypothetical protein
MTSSFTEGAYLDDFIVSETNRDHRQSFLVEGAAVVPGQILQNGTAATQKKAIVAAGTGANCVALNAADVGERVFVLGQPGHATLKRSGLTYGPSATTNQKADTDALLRAVGLVVLTSVVGQ